MSRLENTWLYYAGEDHQKAATRFLAAAIERYVPDDLLEEFWSTWAGEQEHNPLVEKIALSLQSIGERLRAANFLKNGGLLLKACDEAGITDKRELAYLLATASHESYFAPIREVRAKSGPVKLQQDQYWNTGFYGRGFSMITWEANYEKFSKVTGVDLVADPDAALVPDTAARILAIGMRDGLFTGLGFTNLPSPLDFVQARRIINGTDKARLIAGYAEWYLTQVED